MGGKGRYLALDSWRGLCALLVAMFHFPILGHIHDSAIVRHSYLFVDFFFVLSGFIIAETQGRRPDSLWPFLIKRFGRIWPLHAAVLLAFVAVSVLQGDIGQAERHSRLAIVTNLLLIHAWGMHRDLTWNGPSWSISVEWLLYMMFAFLAPLPGRRFVYAGLVVLGISVLFFFAPNGMQSTFDFGIYRGLAGFFMGALIARAPLRDFGTWGEIAAAAGVAIFVTLGLAPFAGPIVFGAAVYVFAGSSGKLSQLLWRRPFVWVGERSFSIYMLHALAVSALWMVGGRLHWTNHAGHMDAGRAGDLFALPYVLAVLTMAWAVYPAEVAARDWFKGLATRSQRSPVVA